MRKGPPCSSNPISFCHKQYNYYITPFIAHQVPSILLPGNVRTSLLCLGANFWLKLGQLTAFCSCVDICVRLYSFSPSVTYPPALSVPLNLWENTKGPLSSFQQKEPQDKPNSSKDQTGQKQENRSFAARAPGTWWCHRPQRTRAPSRIR